MHRIAWFRVKILHFSSNSDYYFGNFGSFSSSFVHPNSTANSRRVIKITITTITIMSIITSITVIIIIIIII